MENNEYRIVIELTGTGIARTNTNQTQKPNKTEAEKVAERRERTITRIVKYDIGTSFLNTTKSIVQNEVDTYYGSGELSQRINAGMSIATSAYSIVSQGGILSSALGIGAVAGTGVALGIFAFKKTLEVVSNTIEINNKRRIENEQLQLLRGRAGIQFNRSRVGE